MGAGEVNLITSVVDRRSYRHLYLENGLEVLLVQDASVEKAAASLTVNVGSHADPENLPGLAHFLEHLLFMGTEKYPEESSYMDFLIANAGCANAFTAAEHTNFHFDVSASAFEEALDRFSQFFVAPLFSSGCQEREVRAVDSEFKKNIRQDGWRISQLEKTLSNPKHPWHKFSTGNFETLERMPKIMGIDVRQTLIAFYHEHYSASLMKLALVGNQDLGTLEAWARGKFELIPRGQQPKVGSSTLETESPLLPEHLCKAVFVQPVKHVKQLEIVFPVPDQQPLVATQPHLYFSYLLKNEGDQSLLAHLKRQGWATGISAGVTHIAKGYDQFLIAIDLSSAGVEVWKTVLEVVFAYIELVNQQGPQQWLVKEIQQTSLDAFNYGSKSKSMTLARNLSQAMHRPIPRERLLNFSVVTEYSPEELKKFGRLLNRSNFRAFIISDEHHSDLPLMEKYYGTRYAIEDLAVELIRVPGLSLPEPNPFIPDNYHVDSARTPAVIRIPVGNSALWFKTPQDASSPKVCVFVKLGSFAVMQAPACAEMLCALVTELVMQKYGYAAREAGLDFAITHLPSGFEVRVAGFSSRSFELLSRLLTDFSSYTAEQAIHDFNYVRDKLCQDLDNHRMAPPYQQLMNYSDFIFEENTFRLTARLEALRKLEVDRLCSFINVPKKYNLEMLVLGTVSKTEAVTALETASGLFPVEEPIVRPRPLRLLPGTNVYWSDQLADPENTNSAIDYCISFGDADNIQNHANLLVILQLIQEPVFHQLRTVEQLGYIVGCTQREIGGEVYLRVYAQCEESTILVQKRIESILSALAKSITSTALSKFLQVKQAAIDRLMEKPTNLNDEADRVWGEIRLQRYNFSIREEIARFLGSSVTLESVAQLFSARIDPDSKHRASVVTHLVARKEPLAPPLETALAKSVGRLVFENKIQVNPMEIMKFAMECRGLTVDQAMASLYKRMVDGGKTPDEAQCFIQEALDGARSRQEKSTEAEIYQGTQILDVNEFRKSLIEQKRISTSTESDETTVEKDDVPRKHQLRVSISATKKLDRSQKTKSCACCSIM